MQANRDHFLPDQHTSAVDNDIDPSLSISADKQPRRARKPKGGRNIPKGPVKKESWGGKRKVSWRAMVDAPRARRTLEAYAAKIDVWQKKLGKTGAWEKKIAQKAIYDNTPKGLSKRRHIKDVDTLLEGEVCISASQCHNCQAH